MITNLRLKNFKSIQKDEIELKPLTLLTGPNSSGKSNIIQSIAVVSQIAKTASTTALTFPQHLESKDAEYYSFPKPASEFMVYKGELEREIAIEIHMLSGISKRSIGYSIKYTSDPIKTEQMLFVNKRPMFHTSFAMRDDSWQSTFSHPLRWKGENTESPANNLLRPNCFFLPMGTITRKERKGKISRKVDMGLRERANRLTNEVTKELMRVYLISAPRGAIKAETPAGPDPTWVGKNGENVIYILSKIFGKSKYRSIQQKISTWSERFGVGNIAAGLKKGMILGADFEDPRLKTVFDMTSASYGSRQLLTIITQIFWSKSGDTLLIEEPEISLHPQSQVLIQELFAEAVNEGKQIICSTHSPFFILSLSKVVGNNVLSKNDVVIYHVEKGIEGTKTRRLELNDRGFVVGWIPSFMDIENKLFNDWVGNLD